MPACTDTDGNRAAAQGEQACGTATAPCPKRESRCPGTDADKADEGIRNALEEQRRMLSAREAELETWDDAAQQRFMKWFGTTDEAARSTIRERITKMKQLNSEMSLEHFYAAEGRQAKKPGLYAYVYPDDEGKVYLGQKFCQSPVAGENSKAGALCHEMSHFTSVGSTDDHAYGTTKSLRLATKRPAKALMNADNFEYYCEGL